MKITILLFCSAMLSFAEVSPYMGLWVGSAGMTAVNEVSTPFDADNVERAPNPLVATPASGRADVRLIIHVDAAGRAKLLKDVAIINRNMSGNASATAMEIAAAGSDEFSIALVSDPALYADYPMTKATRYTSVVFDFGDAQTTTVLDALVDKVVNQVIGAVKVASPSQYEPISERNKLSANIVKDVTNTLSKVVMADDVDKSFDAFLESVKSSIPSIASTPSAADTWLLTAQKLADDSPFNDTRALQLVQAVIAAGNVADAWNAAADWADSADAVSRLLSSEVAGKALAGAAKHAAANPGATAQDLRELSTSTELLFAASASKGTWDNDSRAESAVFAMFEAVAAAAPEGQAKAIMAGQRALQEAQATMSGANGPGTDYSAFVNSPDYASAAGRAAKAAADAALLERAMNPLTYEGRVAEVAKAAAVNALQNTYTMAARAKMNELPLRGVFAPGSGDTRFTMELGTNVLGVAGLEGTILLPANFAINPFRHRRHPDHTRGFDIRRELRFDFDANDAEGLAPSVTRGVETLGGMYREEIFGLHKALGPDRNLGLRAEGRFILHKVSSIGTLNNN